MPDLAVGGAARWCWSSKACCRSSRRASGATRSASSTELSDGQLRFIGLASMAVGVAGLWLVQSCVSGSCPSTSRTSCPPKRSAIEALRRTLLDHFRAHGYRLVQPPLVEHLDSLLTGTGHDLDLQTFKVVDPMSGRLLGVRADITPQVARIDAHLLNEPGVTRLCYAGSVLRTDRRGPGDNARGHADRRRALRRAGDRRRPRGARACCCRRSRAVGRRAACTSTSATSASIARSPHGAGIAGNGERRRALRRAARQGCAGRGRAHRHACRPRGATRCARCPTLYGPAARRARRRARAPARHAGDRATRSPRSRRSRARRRRRSRRCTSISPTCAAIITRTARSSRCSPPASPARSATAAATTASARRSAARVRRPDSRSTCGSSRHRARATGDCDCAAYARSLEPLPAAHGQERRRHRHPVGRRRQGQDRRLADRAARRASCASRAATTPVTRW